MPPLYLRAVCVTALFCLMPLAALAQDEPGVYVSGGPTGELLLAADGTEFTSLFVAAGGFRPGEIALAGDGRLYICDASSSQVHRFDPLTGSLTTIYDRSNAVAPNDPEQPKACTIAGNDLLFLSRNGNGGSAKTGLWAIRNVAAPTPGAPRLLLGLDAVAGVSGEGLAVNFDGRVFFTFGNEVWVAEPTPGAGRVDANSTFRRWGSTVAQGFGLATKGVVHPTSGALRTLVFVAAKFGGVVEVLREVTVPLPEPEGATIRVGSAQGCSIIDVPDLPNAVEFDGSGDLWVAASAQSSGRRGSVYKVVNPRCAAGPFTVEPRGAELGGALGIALTPTGSSPTTLVFPEGSEKSDTVNLCNSIFNLAQVVEQCQDTWTVSCRLMPQSEFQIRTGYAVGAPAGTAGDVVEQDFSFTQCADFPSASGNCTEIRISQTQVSACTEDDVIGILANWQFYSLTDLAHPGLLYSPGDFPSDVNGDPVPENSPFSENIMRDYDPVPLPTDPLDPRATGSRDAWGSGLVVVDDAPNRPPTAVLTVTPTVTQCGGTVTLDGSGSFDNDWNVDHRDAISNYAFSVDGTLQQSSAVDFLVFDTTGLGPGSHTASLQVSDEGWDVNGPLTDTATTTFQVGGGGAPPVIARFALQDLGDPRVTINADGNAMMWPPNHEMVAFKALYAAFDDCQASCSLKITSNEPANGTGDGDIAPDFELTGRSAEAFFFNLRAERAQSGDGRVYTLSLECSDGVTTTTSAPIKVTVASSQSGG